MKDELFLAILAMDAYNRSYGAGLDLSSTSGSKAIGAATFKVDSSDKIFFPADDAQAAGFCAVAYEWTPKGEPTKTVISYRGTDSFELSNPANDVLNGWLAGIGKKTSQVGLAATH